MIAYDLKHKKKQNQNGGFLSMPFEALTLFDDVKRKCSKYVACPKSPVTHTFYSERIAGTNNRYSCRIIGHIGTYFTVQNDTHFNDLTATVTLVTISRHDRSKSNYAKCFALTTILWASFSDNVMKFENDLILWVTNKIAYL